jgi:hypothetical protein
MAVVQPYAGEGENPGDGDSSPDGESVGLPIELFADRHYALPEKASRS